MEKALDWATNINNLPIPYFFGLLAFCFSM